MINKYKSLNTALRLLRLLIWQDILNLKVIDRQSLFFEISGHSLKAIQVVSRIYKEMQVEITLKDFFENATLQKLAALIDRQQPTSYLKITPAPNQPVAPKN